MDERQIAIRAGNLEAFGGCNDQTFEIDALAYSDLRSRERRKTQSGQWHPLSDAREVKEQRLIRHGLFSRGELDHRNTIARVLAGSCYTFRHGRRLEECCQRFMHFSCEADSTNRFKKHHVAIPMRCESRWCPRCARVRGYKVLRRLRKLLKKMHKKKGQMLMLLTLSKRRSGFLTREKVARFSKDVRTLINTCYPKKNSCGALSVWEVGKHMNLHAHCIVYGPYVHQRTLSRIWREITGDSFVVDIRAVSSYKPALDYVTKYISKVPRLEKEDQYSQLVRSFHRIRRLHTFGVFYNNIPDDHIEFLCPVCGKKLERFVIPEKGGNDLPIYYALYDNYLQMVRAS